MVPYKEVHDAVVAGQKRQALLALDFPASNKPRLGCPAQWHVLGPATPDPSAGHDEFRYRNCMILALYVSVLRRHGNNAAGKSAAERRCRGGRGGIGRGLGSGAMTLR
jgi:hypothetical protein